MSRHLEPEQLPPAMAQHRKREQSLKKPSIQHGQEQAIAVRELDATAHPPLQHDQLMSERRVLCFKSALRLEG
jgi:hypothetical protein